MLEIKKEDCFQTADLYFAAFLKVSAVPFVDCVSEGRKKIFLFENISSIKELKLTYFRKEPVKIAPFSYVNEIQALKALVHM